MSHCCSGKQAPLHFLDPDFGLGDARSKTDLAALMSLCLWVIEMENQRVNYLVTIKRRGLVTLSFVECMYRIS